MYRIGDILLVILSSFPGSARERRVFISGMLWSLVFYIGALIVVSIAAAKVAGVLR